MYMDAGTSKAPDIPQDPQPPLKPPDLPKPWDGAIFDFLTDDESKPRKAYLLNWATAQTPTTKSGPGKIAFKV
jgi:hypothetical protein